MTRKASGEGAMTGDAIHPVILCGGGGTRLWPLSRRSYPKQFNRFFGASSLFQATLRRLSGPGFAPPVVVTADAFRFVAGEQAAEAGIVPRALAVEPAPRNTAPAVLAAAEVIAAVDPDGVMIVAPSDHVIADDTAFRAAVHAAARAARDGVFVAFGVRPDRPETGYGYLELGDGAGPAPLRPFRRFVEKPDAASAAAMVAAGGFLWNAGLFCLPVAGLRAAFERLAPDIVRAVRPAVAEAARDLDFLRLGPGFAAAPDISLDYAIMERMGGGLVAPLDCGWNDLGSWRTVWSESRRDAQGVAAGAATTAIDCRDTLLRSEDGQVELVGIGLDGIAAIAMRDAVLVARLDRAQDVREAVAALKLKGAAQAESFPRVHRPWGWFETLVAGERFLVKRIVVRPGRRLSLQSHLHRSEHWVVVTGTAQVTLGDEVRLLSENQSAYIPLGQHHRLENPGRLDLHLIEVASGAYLGEDDITRWPD